MFNFLKMRVIRYSKTVDRYGDDWVTVTETFRHPRGIFGWISRCFGTPEKEPTVIQHIQHRTMMD